MRSKIFILVLTLLLASFLRLWRLGDYPALNADEAAIGYNALSLIETRHDEHGNYWPIHFQSFNDYKPGLIFYLVLPVVKIFGLSVLSVRTLPAILGVASVLAIWFLVKEMFPKKEWLPEASALFLAISPWHIHFSRGAWEANVATFFVIAGVYSFIKASSYFKYYYLSVFMFVLSLYTYHSARVVVPILVVGLLVFNFSEIIKKKREFILPAMFGLILLMPLALDFSRGQVLSRASGVGLFADLGPLNRINEQRGEHAHPDGPGARLLHNRIGGYGMALLQNWADHFSGEFLFLSGDEIERNKVPGIGQMLTYAVVTLPLGAILMIREFEKSWKIVLLWLAAAPVAAALTFQSPHALRAQSMVIPLTIISAYGFVGVIQLVKQSGISKYLRHLSYIALLIIVVGSFMRYEKKYWLDMARELPFSSQYGVSELVSYMKDNSDKYDRVLITDRYDQPYVLFLFYLKYPPLKFQAEHDLTPRDQFGFSTVESFGKYEFGRVKYQEDRDGRVLMAGTDEEIPNEANVIFKVVDNKYKYFEIVEK